MLIAMNEFILNFHDTVSRKSGGKYFLKFITLFFRVFSKMYSKKLINFLNNFYR